MNWLNGVAAAALRILVVWLVALYLPTLAIFLFGDRQGWTNIVYPLAGLLLALAIWIAAPLLARRIIPTLPPTEQPGAIAGSELQAVILVGAGVLLLGFNLPTLIGVVIAIAGGKVDHMTSAEMARIFLPPALRALIGLWLVIGSHALSAWIVKLRRVADIDRHRHAPKR